MKISGFSLAVAFLLLTDVTNLNAQSVPAQQHTIVYKTKIDFSKHVAVELSPDKKKIVSYPAPTDIKPDLAPVKLKGGYWLSKSGVSPNTAYLAFTRDDYSSLKLTQLTVDQLYLLIRSKTPMVEIWDCGVKGAYTVAQINSFIDKKQLAGKCKCVKLK
jgi:hypothetical protein